MTGVKVKVCESKQLNEIAELLMSARADIVVNKNFVAAVEAISVALDVIAGLEPRITQIDTDKKALPPFDKLRAGSEHRETQRKDLDRINRII